MDYNIIHIKTETFVDAMEFEDSDDHAVAFADFCELAGLKYQCNDVHRGVLEFKVIDIKKFQMAKLRHGF